jgi:hypothetical protein
MCCMYAPALVWNGIRREIAFTRPKTIPCQRFALSPRGVDGPATVTVRL